MGAAGVIGLLIGQPVFPAESLEVLWDAWRSRTPQSVYEVSAEDLRRFPLLEEVEIQRILEEREGPPFRSWEEFFVRTGVDPALRPFLESWLDLTPRYALECWGEGRTDGTGRWGGRIRGRWGSVWGEGRWEVSRWTFRGVVETPWVHGGTFRPVGGWGGPFARSLWSSLALEDVRVISTRLDTVFRVWVHVPVGRIRVDGVYPDRLVGVEAGTAYLWVHPSRGVWWGGQWAGWGMEGNPDTVFPWAFSWRYRGTVLRWVWRWAPATAAMEGRWWIRLGHVVLRWRYLTRGVEEGSFRARASGRWGRTRWWAGWWEDGGWLGVRRGRWRWRWGWSSRGHRVEVGYRRGRGWIRAGVVEGVQTVRLMNRSWEVRGGYVQVAWALQGPRFRVRVQGMLSQGEEGPRMGLALRGIWRGEVPSWIPSG